jgi:hypothetical protein
MKLNPDAQKESGCDSPEKYLGKAFMIELQLS